MKGRVGCLLGVDEKNEALERRREEREKREEARRVKALNESLKPGTILQYL